MSQLVEFQPDLILMDIYIPGCSGLEPYESRNDRVAGPDRGLVSGEAGEFVVYREN